MLKSRFLVLRTIIKIIKSRITINISINNFCIINGLLPTEKRVVQLKNVFYEKLDVYENVKINQVQSGVKSDNQ